MERIKKLQKKIAEEKLDALYISDLVDLYYLTGRELTAGKMVVTPKTATLIVDGRYFESCKQISRVNVLLEKEGVLNSLLVGKIGFSEQKTTVGSYHKLKDKGGEWIPADSILEKLREIKDDSEVDLLRKAANLGSKGFDHICSILKEGITEKEVAQELSIFWLKEGGDGLAFDPIIAFGTSTSMPHYRPREVPLKKGDVVLIDIGVKLKHYHSDMTRVVFFQLIDQKVEEIYHIVKEAQQLALDACQPGILTSDLDSIARSFITEKGYGDAFSHGLGHGVGLEIHEAPTLRKKGKIAGIALEEGMAITIEPGVYLPGIGGVRIEDTIVITNSGYENLTNRSKEIHLIG